MSTADNEPPDPDDMFKDTRMSFGDHIEDLRSHMFRALKGFVVGMLLGIWPLGSYVLQIIVDPLDEELYQFERRKLTREQQEEEARFQASGSVIQPVNVEMKFRRDELQNATGNAGPPPVLGATIRAFDKLLLALNAHNLIDKETREQIDKEVRAEEKRRQDEIVTLNVQISDPRALIKRVMDDTLDVRRPKPSTMGITEAFMVYLKVALLTGLVISSPWIFYSLWMFIAAGLYPHEKRLVNVYLPVSLTLFLVGAVVCQIFVMPKAIRALLSFNEWFGFAADMRLSEWLWFALMMPVVFGVSFQTPLVMMFLHRVGILTIAHFRDYRRIAWFTMAVLAAVFMPTPDAISMLFLWVPMVALYELGILVCVWQGDYVPIGDDEEKESHDLVEV